MLKKKICREPPSKMPSGRYTVLRGELQKLLNEENPPIQELTTFCSTKYDVISMLVDHIFKSAWDYNACMDYLETHHPDIADELQFLQRCVRQSLTLLHKTKIDTLILGELKKNPERLDEFLEAIKEPPMKSKYAYICVLD